MSRNLRQAAEVERLLSFETVCSLTSWSRPSIYRLMKADKFPKPVSLGDHRVAFKESDIQKYISSRTSIENAVRPPPLSGVTGRSEKSC